MSVHLQKLSVGTQSIEHLARWQAEVAARRHARGQSPVHVHVTRMFPKQKEALLDGGSLYWVIKGLIICRNRIIGLEETRNAQGQKACAILMDPELVPVVPAPRRAFQGWRYLKAEDAPDDLSALDELADMPPKLRSKLIEYGLW